MKTLFAIKPKNENDLFSQTLRQFKKKEILFGSPSISFFPQKQSLIYFNPLQASSIKSLFNMTTTSKSKSAIKEVYLSYLNNRSQSFKDIKATYPFHQSFHSLPFNYLASSKKNIKLNMNYDTLPLPFKEQNTTISSNKSFDKYHNELNNFNKMAKRFSEEDYKELTKRLILTGTFDNTKMQKNKYPRKKINQLVIHNIFLQGLMTEIKKEIDARHQLNQYVSENYICDLIKEEFNNIKISAIKRKRLENATTLINSFNKKTMKFEDKTAMKMESQPSVANKNKGIELQDNVHNENRMSLLFKPSDREIKLNSKVNDSNKRIECNSGKHSPENISIEDNCVMIQPTKNEKMKENIGSKTINKNLMIKIVTDDKINDNNSDNSLSQDLLNEYIHLNTNIQDQIINTQFTKNKNTIDNQTQGNKEKQKKLSLLKKQSESIDDKKLIKQREYQAMRDINIKNKTQIKRTASGYISTINKKHNNKSVTKNILHTNEELNKDKINLLSSKICKETNEETQKTGKRFKCCKETIGNIHFIDLNNYI